MTKSKKDVVASLTGPDSVPAPKEPLDDETDYQVTRRAFNKIGIPYIRPRGIPSIVPEESRTAACLVIGGGEDKIGVWFCFDRAGGYTGILLRRGMFVPAGRGRSLH